MADRGIEGWIDKVGGTGLPKKLILDLQNLKLRKEVLPRTPLPILRQRRVHQSQACGPSALPCKGLSGPLTSFTEMHMAQMSTNILPNSCSHPILCVRAKGCGRAWEEGKEWMGARRGLRKTPLGVGFTLMCQDH